MVDSTYQVFVDLDATALEGGYVYIGVPYGDPETSPVALFWDEALTISAAQPLRTSGGYIVRNGTPSNVYGAESLYSVRVRNSQGRVVYYAGSTGGDIPASKRRFPIAAGANGPVGPAGPANSTYATLALMKAADPAKLSYILATPTGPITYAYVAGNFTGADDEVNVVKLTNTPLTTGALVRQNASSISVLQTGDGAVPENALATLRAMGARAAQFGADPTGGTNATEQVRDWMLRGGELYIPHGEVYEFDNELVITVDGSRLTGGGILRVTPAIINKSAIRISANDCEINGVVVSNPTLSTINNGSQTYGISIDGHRNKIIGCAVLDYDMCISITPGGEFYDNYIAGCYLRVIGAGDGPGNTTSGRGEDRGDGVADFGARTRIIGNTVQAANALPGQNFNDCRIGIDVEALSAYGDQTGPDAGSGCEIIGNIIIPSEDGRGRFRRCISIEGTRYVRCSGNYGRGWTWCGIWVVATYYTTVSDNVLKGDCPIPDFTGAAWGPRKAGILVYAETYASIRDVIVESNIIDCTTEHSHGIFVVSVAGAPVDRVIVRGNKVITHVQSGNLAGYLSIESNKTQFVNNECIGLWGTGFVCSGGNDLVYRGNIVRDAITISYNVSCSGTMIVDGNYVIDANAGFRIAGGLALIRDNVLRGLIVQPGISLDGAGMAWVTNNFSFDGQTQINNYSSRPAKVGPNPGFVYDERVDAVQITSATSFLNTHGKRPGQIAIDKNNVAYFSTGPDAGAAWKRFEDGGLVTPA